MRFDRKGLVYRSCLVLSTGGTYDKDYGSGARVRDMHIGDSYAEDFLPQALGHDLFVFRRAIGKDSLDMTPADRRMVVALCETVPQKQIIVTHGSDTMHLTARAIARSKKISDKIIVLTGALRPARMKVTDAEFNLGLAVATLFLSKPGVYVALSGIFKWDAFKKNKKTGVFEPV